MRGINWDSRRGRIIKLVIGAAGCLAAWALGAGVAVMLRPDMEHFMPFVYGFGALCGILIIGLAGIVKIAVAAVRIYISEGEPEEPRKKKALGLNDVRHSYFDSMNETEREADMRQAEQELDQWLEENTGKV